MIAFILYLISGSLISLLLMNDSRWTIRIWLGLVFGCVLLMWLPCLFAFSFGFAMKAQLYALLAAMILPLPLLLFHLRGGFVLPSPS